MTRKITEFSRALAGLLHDPKRHLMFGQAARGRAVDHCEGAGLQGRMKAEIARLIQRAPVRPCRLENKNSMKKVHITGLDGSYLAKMLLPKGTAGRRTKLLQEYGLDVPVSLEG